MLSFCRHADGCDLPLTFARPTGFHSPRGRKPAVQAVAAESLREKIAALEEKSRIAFEEGQMGALVFGEHEI